MIWSLTKKLWSGTLWVGYEQDWRKGRENIQKKICHIHCNSFMTLTLGLHVETWFKVTVHPLPTMWVKYEPEKGQGERRYAPDKEFLMDEQPNNYSYRTPTRWGPSFWLFKSFNKEKPHIQHAPCRTAHSCFKVFDIK